MFNNNPYRFLGVISNSGIKNIQKNLSKIKAYSKIGKHLTLPYELSFFNLLEINRSESLINDAENKILLDPNKIKYSLFWFIDNSSIDKIALENLNKGNFEKSENIWRKVIKDKSISKSNFSAYNNLSTLLFLKSLAKNKNNKFENSKTSVSLLKEALRLKSELIFSKQLNELSNLITGNENTIIREDVLEFFNENILQLFNQNFSSTEISSIIKNSNNELSQSFNFSLINEPLESLRDLMNDANNSVNKDHSKGVEIGKDLIKNSVSYLKLLKDILGKNDMQYQSISDKLANQIMQCGILCFNKTQDDKDYLSSYKYAKSISFKESTIERANNTIKHCEDELKANICGFCNSNEVIKRSGMRVKMHKMNWDNTYSYFKNGGIEIPCCKSCSSSNSNKKIKAFFIGLFAWAAISAGSFGWFLGIDFLFAGFSMSKWIFRKIKTKFYYDEIKSHPIILKLILEGYKFGMP
mgnify:CR=1 FL=1|tara:strand:- start:7258 stop:8664 length:1407 start_codon:yes stop_codon:yes gene_type:complete